MVLLRSNCNSDEWIDISMRVAEGMVLWPGTPDTRVERLSDVGQGDPYTLSSLSLDTHTGTHMDAPRHFIEDGAGIDRMPFVATVGPARVLEVPGVESIAVEHLEPLGISSGERLLLKTDNSLRDWEDEPFREEYSHLTLGAAEYLAEIGIRCAGIDYLSIAAFETDAAETHRALLEAGVWIVEGLVLHGVEPGDYEMVCLPLRIVGADGSPARAILRML